MTKKEIRMQIVPLKNALTDDGVHQLSQKLLEHFVLLDLSCVETIHVFLPITEKREPDTFMILDWLKLNYPDIKIIVPRADFNTAMMSHYEYEGHQNLVKNIYNILEPETGILHIGDVDIVLVPLLAFDQRGYRVGYGKGFYDRFLKNIKTKKVGLSFFGAVEDIDDIHENDIRLDACITPKGIVYF